ncbi:hypothetical protein ZIOFF_028670 [Zingiber officinale]|uniref:PPPDE domain-containing protein n=1 Tax=Zingiber officinale TaxID=94328 RepID=A0A8J5LE01_ZINOF|nr:hypothetical protein ZIOFF_028670 [Zingiber officinale]
MYTYRERIVLGETDCSIFDVNMMLRELSQAWPGQSYDLLAKNCNHFCDTFCERPSVPKLPVINGNAIMVVLVARMGWVNRFANAGDTAVVVAGNAAFRLRQAKQEIVTASKVAYRFMSGLASNPNSEGTPESPSNYNRGIPKFQGAWFKNLMSMGAKPSTSTPELLKSLASFLFLPAPNSIQKWQHSSKQNSCRKSRYSLSLHLKSCVVFCLRSLALGFKKSDIGAWPADSSDAHCQLPRLHPRSPHAVGCPARPSPRGSAAASTKAAADASFPIVASTGGDAGARIALSDLIPWANAASASAEGKAVSGSETTTTATAERDAFPCDAFNGRSAPLRVPRMWKGILFVPGPRRPQKQPPEAPLGAGARIAVSDLIPWANAASSASAGGKAVFAFVPGAETRTAAAERDAFSCDAFNGRSAPLRVPRMRKSILFVPGTRRPQKHPPEAAVAQRLQDRKAETRQGEKSNAMPSISLTECSPMNWGLGIDLNQPAIEKD